MLGDRRNVVSHKIPQVADTEFTMHKGFGNQQTGGMPQGLENGNALGLIGEYRRHAWLFGKLAKF